MRIQKANREKILADNPKVIIFVIMWSETGVAAKEKHAWYHYSSINGVKNHRIHIISPELNLSAT